LASLYISLSTICGIIALYVGVKNAANTFNANINPHLPLGIYKRQHTHNCHSCQLRYQQYVFRFNFSDTTPAKGEKMIYAVTRKVRADANIAAALSGLIS
jgi:hypothetical protein